MSVANLSTTFAGVPEGAHTPYQNSEIVTNNASLRDRRNLRQQGRAILDSYAQRDERASADIRAGELGGRHHVCCTACDRIGSAIASPGPAGK
jgi:hypothetical protein